MTIDEIITILRTPVDYAPLLEEANAIKAELNAISEKLDEIENSLS